MRHYRLRLRMCQLDPMNHLRLYQSMYRLGPMNHLRLRLYMCQLDFNGGLSSLKVGPSSQIEIRICMKSSGLKQIKRRLSNPKIHQDHVEREWLPIWNLCLKRGSGWVLRHLPPHWLMKSNKSEEVIPLALWASIRENTTESSQTGQCNARHVFYPVESVSESCLTRTSLLSRVQPIFLQYFPNVFGMCFPWFRYVFPTFSFTVFFQGYCKTSKKYMVNKQSMVNTWKSTVLLQLRSSSSSSSSSPSSSSSASST